MTYNPDLLHDNQYSEHRGHYEVTQSITVRTGERYTIHTIIITIRLSGAN